MNEFLNKYFLESADNTLFKKLYLGNWNKTMLITGRRSGKTYMLRKAKESYEKCQIVIDELTKEKTWEEKIRELWRQL